MGYRARAVGEMAALDLEELISRSEEAAKRRKHIKITKARALKTLKEMRVAAYTAGPISGMNAIVDGKVDNNNGNDREARTPWWKFWARGYEESSHRCFICRKRDVDKNLKVYTRGRSDHPLNENAEKHYWFHPECVFNKTPTEFRQERAVEDIREITEAFAKDLAAAQRKG